MSIKDIERLVRSFIGENLLHPDGGKGLSSTVSLLDTGLIDPAGIRELVAFIEAEFALRIADAEVVPENFDSIGCIAAFIAARQHGAAAAA